MVWYITLHTHAYTVLKTPYKIFAVYRHKQPPNSTTTTTTPDRQNMKNKGNVYVA